MLAQRLRHRVNVERLQTVQDAETGAKSETFVSFISDEPAEIYALSGSEFVSAQALQGRVTHRITMRRQEGVRPSMRIVDHDGEVYNIRAILPDFKQRQWLTMMCESGVNDGR